MALVTHFNKHNKFLVTGGMDVVQKLIKSKEKMKSSTKYKREGEDQCWVVSRRKDIYLLNTNLGICPFTHQISNFQKINFSII
jgi:hypothetical protein